jgi:hypothetical protein
MNELNRKSETETVWECLVTAIERFNASGDQDTLLRPRNRNSPRGPAAGERAIAHRLAYYLERSLRNAHLIEDTGPLCVDCEYNRHGGAAKAVAIESALKSIVLKARGRKRWEPDEDGRYIFSVEPDIVVHERGHDGRNRLIVEIKKASNHETQEYDQLKLELFTTSRKDEYGYGYDVGAWVIAEDTCAPCERKLQIDQKWVGGKRIE